MLHAQTQGKLLAVVFVPSHAGRGFWRETEPAARRQGAGTQWYKGRPLCGSQLVFASLSNRAVGPRGTLAPSLVLFVKAVGRTIGPSLED